MKVLIGLISVVLVCAGGTGQANVAPPSGDAVRAELSAYFANIDENAPTMLGGLAASPEAMQAIQERIRSMSDAEVAEFQKLLAETPDWRVAPEAFAGAFPPEMLAHIRRVGASYAESVPRGEKMRDDAQALIEVLKLLPDAKLEGLGIDREKLKTLDATFEQMSALQATMLERNGVGSAAFGEKSALALHALPSSLQRGAEALAKHGPLTEIEQGELRRYRGMLLNVLSRIDKLPESARAKLNAADLTAKMADLAKASPEALYMVRDAIPESTVVELQRNVALLERLSTFTDDERKELEHFRAEFATALKETEAGNVDAVLGDLGPQHLFLLQKKMESYGAWQVALPAVYRSLESPDLADRLRAVEGASANPAAIANLEQFRAEALAYVNALGADSNIDPSLVARARTTIETAPRQRLEMIRMAAERLPSGATAADKLAIVALHETNLNCSLSFQVTPAYCIPEWCFEVCDPTGVLGCWSECTPEVCFPEVRVDLNFDVVCNPIEDAIDAVEHSITAAANAAIGAMQSGIESTLATLESSVRSAIVSVNSIIDDAVAAITSVVDDIAEFVETIPDKAWAAIKLALNALLDIEIRNGVTVRQLIASGVESALQAMTTLIGLSGEWWTAVSTFTLPAIPCPPSGFHTPFGDVGDGAASDNYARYKLLIDGIIGMIPDTEVSLAVKIPAQVAYLAYDFLGTCLEQAAAEADAEELTERHTLVLENFASLQTFIGTSVAGLAAATGSQTQALVATINTSATTLMTAIDSQSTATKAVITAETQATQDLLDAESTAIQALLQAESDATQSDIAAFRALITKLTVERVLQAGTNNEIGYFQLRAPWGQLALVASVVKDTIDAMVTAQESIGQAMKYYDSGMQLMGAGRDKEAFRAFALAYRETTR